MSPNNSEDLIEQITNTSVEQLKKGFIHTERVDVDKEIEQREKVDGYELRKCFNQSIQKALSCLPYVFWIIVGVCVICICGMLIIGTLYIVKDEKKLLEVIWGAIWTALVSMSSIFLNNFFKKK